VTAWRWSKTPSRTLCCVTTTHRLTLTYRQGIFDQKQHDCRPPLTLFLSASLLKIKLRSLHFDTMRCSRQNRRRCETPSQNTTSRRHFKHGRSAENGAYARKRTNSRVMVASRTKVSFWSDASTSPGNYGWLHIYIYIYIYICVCVCVCVKYFFFFYCVSTGNNCIKFENVVSSTPLLQEYEGSRN
jgi:hypothetical protein